MSHTARSNVAPPPERGGGRQALIGGLVVFAAVLLIVDGILSVFRGIMAIGDDAVFVTTQDYVFRFSLTGWGVFHLVIGALAVIVGFSLFSGALWARALGILLAGVNVIVNFLALPYYPLWSIVVIALDVLIIWALASYRPQPA